MSELDFDKENTECNAPKATQPSKESGGFICGLVEQIELIVIAFALLILVFSFVFRTCEVSGPSMENTLLDKETVLISNVFYTPERNDIIVFHQTGEHYNEPIVKRVIGLPGDTVNIEYFSDHMKVTVISPDGTSTVLKEDYVKYNGAKYYSNSSTYVEDGTIFVMGDNRSVSADSRAQEIGLVDTRRILGKVVLRLTPFDRFGKVD